MKTGPIYSGLVWLLLSLLHSVAMAEELAITLSNGNQALADYRPGEAGKPAVLLIHGFLQTYKFSTIQLMADELADNGYTVLAPTITLNINQRRQGLNCNAIQNHTVADGSSEIGSWVQWLKRQGYSHIIAIGHSTGSLRLLSYLGENPQHGIQSFIPVSIAPMGNWRNPDIIREQIATARLSREQTPNAIGKYSLAFCHHNYAAPAAAFLSYMRWSEAWVLQQLQDSRVALHLVIGGEDSWLPLGWPEKLQATTLPLTTIAEASHNFTGPQEFAFQDAIVSLVDQAQDSH